MKIFFTILLFINSIFLLLAMESDAAKGNLQASENEKGEEGEESEFSFLFLLPAEILRKIAFSCISVNKDDLEAINCFRRFAFVILQATYKSYHIIDLIEAKNSKEKYISFFAKHLNVNHFYIARKLKILLPMEIKRKFKALAIENELQINRLTHADLNRWLKYNRLIRQNQYHARFFNMIITPKAVSIKEMLALARLIDCDFVSDNMLFGMTFLMWSAKNGFKDRCEFLLKLGSNPDIQDITGMSALMFAVICGRKNIVRLLIESGCQPDLKNRWGNTALLEAVNRNEHKITKILLKTKGTNPNVIDKNGDTPLICAVKKGYKSIVELLLSAKGINTSDEYAHQAFVWAKIHEREDIVDLFKRYQKEA